MEEGKGPVQNVCRLLYCRALTHIMPLPHLSLLASYIVVSNLHHLVLHYVQLVTMLPSSNYDINLLIMDKLETYIF